jgi:serine/threonine protein kinase
VNKTLIKSHGIELVELIDTTSRIYLWKAVQKTLDRTVFLLVLNDELSADEESSRYFILIARQFAKLKSESLAAIFDIVSDGQLHYVVMEYVEGFTLESFLQREGALPFDRLMQIATSVSSAMKTLWNHSRIIHRNLKSASIRFDSRGIAKLTDFTLAIIDAPDFDPEVIDRGHVLGAPSYISPERIGGNTPLTTQSDMYSLGALLYCLSTGKAPFAELRTEEILKAHLTESITAPHRIVTTLPVDFSRVLHRLMIKNPIFRYRNWEEVHHDLHALMEGREPICTQLDPTHLSTIEADFSQVADDLQPQKPTAFKIKTKKRNRYLSEIQDRHLSRHHEADQRSSLKKRNFILWSILVAWLAALFCFRVAVQSGRLSDNPAAMRAEAKIDGLISSIVPSVIDTVEESAANVSEPRPVPDESAVTTLPAPATNDQLPELSTKLRRQFAELLRGGNTDAVIGLLEKNTKTFNGREEMLNTLKNLPDADELVARHLSRNLNRPLNMNIRNIPRTVVAREVRDRIVRLEANGRTVDCDITDLTPEQKANWIGEPQSIGENIVLALLLLQSSNAAQATLYAKGCGVLAPVINEAAGLNMQDQSLD